MDWAVIGGLAMLVLAVVMIAVSLGTAVVMQRRGKRRR